MLWLCLFPAAMNVAGRPYIYKELCSPALLYLLPSIRSTLKGSDSVHMCQRPLLKTAAEMAHVVPCLLLSFPTQFNYLCSPNSSRKIERPLNRNESHRILKSKKEHRCFECHPVRRHSLKRPVILLSSTNTERLRSFPTRCFSAPKGTLDHCMTPPCTSCAYKCPSIFFLCHNIH
ncbi:hypothetical protein BU25DRAFT_5680 [Macroventuria anomochaeta]|uniref:Uncharacterized protein n=1 Tax=Macroventuria anomochaeta TaxID=301207 RepID=A0ACB6SHM3_9PLEO|nr:uncharacterized protein BU25DRAFT_5680 [Macroventuria anomochaeta]KAF2633452.1 hypothetical protein BU25DRAFT_5680 [Macroventuria anomochaeta]